VINQAILDATDRRINAMNRVNAVLDALDYDDRVCVMAAVVRIHHLTGALRTTEGPAVEDR
jgi:hypothetical protein